MRLAVTQAGIVSGAAALKRSEELLAEVAHKAHSFPADMSGGQKQPVLSSGERIVHREAGRILREERNVLTSPNETSSFAEGPSAGAAASHPASRPTQLRSIQRLSSAPGRVEAVSQEVDAGPIWERVTSGADEWRDRAKTAAHRRKRAVRFALVAMADDSLLRVRLDVDGRLARRNTRRPSCQ